MIELHCHVESGGLVVEVVGDLTAASMTTLRSCVDAALDAEMADLVIDVGGVRRVDRSAAAELLDLHRRLARRGRSLQLRNTDACVSGVAKLLPLGDRAS